MIDDSKTNRPLKVLYWGSFIFLLSSSFLIFYQTAIIEALFRSQFSISWQNLLLLISDPNWLETLIQKISTITILIAVFVIVEILIFLTIISLFLIVLWRVKKRKGWVLSDIFLFVGFLALLFSSLLCGIMVITNTLQNITLLQSNFQQVSPEKWQLLAKDLTDFIEKFDFSLTTIFGDISTITKGIQKIINKVEVIAATPTILRNWVTFLEQWRVYFIACFAGSSFVVSVGLVLKTYKKFPFLSRKEQILKTKLSLKNTEQKDFSQQPDEEPAPIAPKQSHTNNELLLTLLQQQQLLLEQLISQQEAEETQKKAIPPEDSTQ